MKLLHGEDGGHLGIARASGSVSGIGSSPPLATATVVRYCRHLFSPPPRRPAIDITVGGSLSANRHLCSCGLSTPRRTERGKNEKKSGAYERHVSRQLTLLHTCDECVPRIYVGTRHTLKRCDNPQASAVLCSYSRALFSLIFPLLPAYNFD